MGKIGELWEALPSRGEKHHCTRRNMRRSLCFIAQRDPPIARSRLPCRPFKPHIGQTHLAGEVVAALGDVPGEGMGGIQNRADLVTAQKSPKAITATKPTMIGGHGQLSRLARCPSQAGTGGNRVICAKLCQLPGIARPCQY